MRAREFLIGEWMVSDHQLMDMFEDHSEILEGANEQDLEELSKCLDDNTPQIKLVVGNDYYPVSFQALLTTLDPTVPALLYFARYPNNVKLLRIDDNSYVFSNNDIKTTFINKNKNGGLLKQTLIFESESDYESFLTFFILKISGPEWKMSEKIL